MATLKAIPGGRPFRRKKTTPKPAAPHDWYDDDLRKIAEAIDESIQLLDAQHAEVQAVLGEITATLTATVAKLVAELALPPRAGA